MGVMYDKILGQLREGEDTSGYAEKDRTPQIITVNGLTNLTGEQLESLKSGDIVMVDAILKYACIVSARSALVVYLSYVDNPKKQLGLAKFQKFGGTWSYVGNSVYPIAEPVETAIPNGGMKPDVFYDLGVLTEETAFNLAAAPDDGCIHVYHWAWTEGSGYGHTFPQEIEKWIGGFPPNDQYGSFVYESYYEVYVCNGIGWWRSSIPSIDRYSVIDAAYHIDSQVIFDYGFGYISGQGWMNLGQYGSVNGSWSYHGTHTFHDGLILIAPNNKMYKLKVANDGTLYTELVS